MALTRILLIVILVGVATGVSKQSATAARSQPLASSHEIANEPAVDATNSKIQKLDLRHLPNALQVHEKVISGGMPEGDDSFAELQTLGIKTIISVDGAKPDVEMAQKYGMRYVHLPHGYDGVPESRAKELAKAVRDLPGP